jgi:hypothetical protein
MLMYPISLRKLFAIDFLSELTAIQSVFAIPAIVAMSLGAGLGSGNLGKALLAGFPTIVFGVALSKWLTTTIGSLVRRKRARGETLVALVGAIAGIGGALAGQLGPLLLKHADSFRSLRWTPPGAAANMLAGSGDTFGYLLSLAMLSAYTVVLVFLSYRIARRSALGLGGASTAKVVTTRLKLRHMADGSCHSFRQLSAVIEKELRYAMRNAQLRMLAFLPLILIVIRVVQTQRVRTGMRSGGLQAAKQFWFMELHDGDW